MTKSAIFRIAVIAFALTGWLLTITADFAHDGQPSFMILINALWFGLMAWSAVRYEAREGQTARRNAFPIILPAMLALVAVALIWLLGELYHVTRKDWFAVLMVAAPGACLIGAAIYGGTRKRTSRDAGNQSR